jgi:hypothetical protein
MGIRRTSGAGARCRFTALRLWSVCAVGLWAACAVDSRSVSSISPGSSGAAGGSSEVGLGTVTDVAGAGGSGNVPGVPSSNGSDPTSSGGPEAAAQLPCAANGAACTEPLGYCLPGAGRCVSCVPGAQRCTAGTVELCNADGAWASQITVCGECIPDSAGCSAATPRVCSSAGRWVDRSPCAGAQPVCVAATATCACDQNSCGAGEFCSAETRSCEPEISDCPAIDPIPGGEDNDLGVVSVRFEPSGSATVSIQNIGGGLIILAAQRGTLCNGADNCIFLSDDVSVTLEPGESFERTLPATLPSGGEVALLSDFPPEAIGFGYVAWGSGPTGNGLEALANADLPYWRLGDRVLLESGDTGFVCTGRADLAAGYVSCNP